ncbi:hypothetical protein [Couchioplanes azureus]|uniref:hypothetical protein n=1 Tax=Couchioplanes caeruleus TaxID=56438 RepID=UPI001670ED44|nr:hypothetical protein [Couchioplanes caeruleus]GGQ42875.1 hypothetical protein GCM10010166_08850 [Couchioplanes caeruleus subsp. azureus]
MDPGKLSDQQRLALAAVTGAGQRWCFGSFKHRPRDEAVASLQQIADPVVLGVAMAGALAMAQIDGWEAARQLARLYGEAGADREVAAAVLAWHHEQSRTGEPGRP